jgi:hypothetical protein
MKNLSCQKLVLLRLKIVMIVNEMVDVQLFLFLHTTHHRVNVCESNHLRILFGR